MTLTHWYNAITYLNDAIVVVHNQTVVIAVVPIVALQQVPLLRRLRSAALGQDNGLADPASKQLATCRRSEENDLKDNVDCHDKTPAYSCPLLGKDNHG
jgi:hypothetical protein